MSGCRAPEKLYSTFADQLGAKAHSMPAPTSQPGTARPFPCGAFGAACVAVHRSNIREWHPPGPNSRSTVHSVVRFRLFRPDPHLPHAV